MPRPKSLDEKDLATAALAILDRDGLDALSMRAVAEELGIGTMSLYRYLKDREQLERWVVELIMSRVDLTLPARASWRKRARLLLERVREIAGEHPAVVPLVLQHRQSSPSLYRWAELLLGALGDAGLRGQRRTLAFRALVSYLVGALQTEHLAPLAGAGTAVLAQLPRAEFPLLAATAREALRIGPEIEFRQGVTFVIRGLARAAARDGEDAG